MSLKKLKTLALPILFATGLGLGLAVSQVFAAEKDAVAKAAEAEVSVAPAAAPAAVASTATANLTTADIQKIVKDYIMENPTVIMDSVDQYQQKSMRDKAAEGIKNNTDSLFKDDKAPFLGNKDGDITIVEFFDFNCGYCKKVLPELQEVVKSDPNLKVVFRDYPILSDSSKTASKWALAAHKQDKYFPFHAALMDHKGPITDDVLVKVAGDVGLDIAKAKTDIGGTEILIQLEKNNQLATQVGVRGTPAFVIGDELFPGALPADELKKLIAIARSAKK